jgi:nitrate reductase gamma subunit
VDQVADREHEVGPDVAVEHLDAVPQLVVGPRVRLDPGIVVWSQRSLHVGVVDLHEAEPRRLWLFPLVVGWAVWGIGVRFAQVPALHTPALVTVPLGIGVGLAAMAVLVWRDRQRGSS